ncbi:SIMPL domain-containing protein [Megamonas hypermegale]|uniref:SIMPL domain-containing protein n=1 Tax=Megamonas hypermegale TaxID=158847 RepID=UPI0025A412ED|nr:SIMPL domain-containing protein [Megamonas hypermegale]MDM8142750.1 SIMPL domain-containing protein [Megamonas hypermegale]
MRKLKITGLMTILCLLISCSMAFAQETRTISVDGTSVIKAMPDRATVNISIESTAKDAKEASAQNAIVMNKIQKDIMALAITKDNIKTTNYNLYPLYNRKDNGRQEITGYSVSNQITVTVDNIDIVGNVIDTAINAGANSVNSVEFSLKDPQSYKDKVLVQAINDAKRKADIIAKTLGKNVVNVVSVNSNNSYIEARTFNSMMYAKAADSAAVGASSPIQAGDISVKANVSIVFEIN